MSLPIRRFPYAFEIVREGKLTYCDEKTFEDYSTDTLSKMAGGILVEMKAVQRMTKLTPHQKEYLAEVERTYDYMMIDLSIREETTYDVDQYFGEMK